MATDTQARQEQREPVNERQEELDGDNAVDKAREELFGEHGVLLDQFGEVVESRRCDR